jgi:hypothetical protein
MPHRNTGTLLLRTLPKNRAANVVGAVADLGACVALVWRLSDHVRTGHGLDRYTTIFGEQMPVAALISIAVTAGVLGAVELSRVLRPRRPKRSGRDATP